MPSQGVKIVHLGSGLGRKRRHSPEPMRMPEGAIGPRGAVDGMPSPTAASPTCQEWYSRQEEFADQPELQHPWIYAMSRRTGRIYCYNTETHKSLDPARLVP